MVVNFTGAHPVGHQV
jgi:hypothetical protein